MRAKALGAPVAVDASKLEDGQMLKVVWRGQPVFVVRRGKAIIDALGAHNDILADPNSTTTLCSQRTSRMPAPRALEIPNIGWDWRCAPIWAARRWAAYEPNNAFQVAGVNLGQSWPGGFYCPCHGSKYDISGRVFKDMPAPKNLTVPSYTFSGDARIVIGEDEVPKSS